MVTIKMFAYFMFFYCNKNKIALDFEGTTSVSCKNSFLQEHYFTFTVQVVKVEGFTFLPDFVKKIKNK